MEKKKVKSRPGYWTAERCIQALEAFLDREGRMPRISEQGPKAGLAGPVAFRKAVGCSYSKYGCRSDEPTHWTAEKCMAAVDRFVQKKGRRPKIQSEANSSSGLPDPKIFRQYTGMTMGSYLKNKYPELPVPRFLELPAPQKCGRIWTKDRIVEATDHFMETYGRYPAVEEYSMKYGLPTRNTILTHFGVPAGVYWKRRYPMAEQGWSTEAILRAFDQFIQAHKRLPVPKELKAENGLPSLKTVERHTEAKSYPEFCRTYYSEYALPGKWTRESCIQALERFLKEYNRCPTQEDCGQHEYLPSAMTFYRHVGESEGRYCAHHHPELRGGWTESEAIEALERFIARNGRPPLTREFCSLNQLPSLRTFQKMVGMAARTFLHERYPKYYEQAGQERSGGQTMQML